MPEIFVTLSIRAKDKLEAYVMAKNIIKNNDRIKIISISTDEKV